MPTGADREPACPHASDSRFDLQGRADAQQAVGLRWRHLRPLGQREQLADAGAEVAEGGYTTPG